MFNLLDPELVVCDVETTDLNLAMAAGVLPSLIEIGAVRIASDCSVLGTFTSLVKPPSLEAFTAQSHVITGITREELEKAPTWDAVWRGFADLTSFNATRLVAWNSYFDAGVLRDAYRRHRLGFPHNPMVMDAMGFAYGFCSQWGIDPGGNWGLAHVCRRFGVERGRRHRALDDALAVVGVLREICCFEDNL